MTGSTTATRKSGVILAAGAAMLALMTACGPSEEATLGQLKAGPADLRFSGAGVEILLPYLSAPVMIANGKSFHVKCDLQGFRARYRYENSGESAAAAHQNASAVVGSNTYSFAQLAMPPSTIRSAHASFGKILVPNVATKLSIRLDAPGVGVVSEASEGNNLWVAKVTRYCP